MISFGITFHNEEKNLTGLFENIKHYTDDIVCTNQESNDRSKEIALLYGARVIDTKRTGYCETDRQTLIDNAKHDWIFIIDADERIPYDIEFAKIVQGKAKAFPLINFIIDYQKQFNPIAGDYQIRLVPRGTGWTSEVHEKPKIEYELLQIPLYHLKTLDDIRESQERYSRLFPERKHDFEWYLSEVLKAR